MAKPRGRALIIDRDPAIRRGLSRALAERDVEALTAEDGPAGVALLAAQPADVALVDAASDPEAGIDTAHAIARDYPSIAIILVTAGPAGAAGSQGSAGAPGAARGVDAAIEAAWSLGADVLPRPIEPLSLGALAVVRALERRRLQESERAAGAAAETAPGELAGTSAAIRVAVRLAVESARTSSPVLVIGEEGTGRDTLARFIHDRSRRAPRAFVSLSCATLADDPEATRLFGGAPASLTGPASPASATSPTGPTAGPSPSESLAHLADRGTLFLDRLELLPAPAQERLAHLLARAEIAPAPSPRRTRTGDATGLPVDVRVIAATAIDLRDAVRAGTFREDLWYRLRALTIRLPPLRARPEDVPLLAYSFLRSLRADTGRDVRRISPEALRLLRHHPYPGNARELHSLLAHAVALARGDVIFPSDLPLSEDVPSAAPSDLFDAELAELPYVEARARALTAFERRYTGLVVSREGGNLSGAARRAGMDRSNFKRLLRRASGRPRDPAPDDD